MSTAARERTYSRSQILEDACALAACGQHGQAGQILESYQEIPGRLHVVLVRQLAGF